MFLHLTTELKRAVSWSTDNDRPKKLVDRQIFYISGHFDRPYIFTSLPKVKQVTGNILRA